MSVAIATYEPLPPRRHRWTWLLLALVLTAVTGLQIYRSAMARKVQHEMAALRSKGFPVTVRELESWLPHVPDTDNAALKIMEAADYLAIGPEDFKRDKWPLPGEELNAAERDEFREILTNNTPSLEALHEAAALRQSRFSLDFNRGPGLLVPHLAKIKSLTQLLKAEAVLASEEGQPERAMRSVLDSVALARALDKEPLLISQLVRIACLSITCTSLERLLSQHALKEPQLTSLSDAFRGAHDASLSAFQAGYIGEVCIGNFVATRPQEALRSLSQERPSRWLNVGVPLYTWTGLRDRDVAFFLRRMHEMLDAAGTPFPQGLSRAREASEKASAGTLGNKLMVFSRMLLPALGRSCEKAAEADARLRCALAGLAIERDRARNNRPAPETLESLSKDAAEAILPDPFNGAPLRYRKLQHGYIVYSVGSDGNDDGGNAGRGKQNSAGSPGATGADVTFQVVR